MLRAVLAVLLATALLAASAPAVEDARTARGEAHARSQVTAIETAAVELATTDDAVRSHDPARRVVEISLSRRTAADAPIDRITIRHSSDSAPGETAVTVRVADGPERTVQVSAPIRPPDGESMVLRGGDRHRLVLSLVDRGAGPVVAVRRAEV